METPWCPSPHIVTIVTKPIVSLVTPHEEFLVQRGLEEPYDDSRPAKPGWEQEGDQELASL